MDLNGPQLQLAIENVMKILSTNVHPVERRISISEQRARNRHGSGILWLTGLSASGKTTLATGLEKRLFESGCQVYMLDGDNIRSGLNADLSFEEHDRHENIRRVGEVAALFADAGLIVIAAFISPYREDRDRIRQAHPELFHEVFIKSSLHTCERRDPKGLYKRARAGQLPFFTGVSDPYEAPLAPEITVDTQNLGVEDCLDLLEDYVRQHIKVPPQGDFR